MNTSLLVVDRGVEGTTYMIEDVGTVFGCPLELEGTRLSLKTLNSEHRHWRTQTETERKALPQDLLSQYLKVTAK